MSDSNPPTELPPAGPPTLVRTPRPAPLLLRLLAGHNPFYLLSAACMLASCLALTNSLSWIPIARTRLLTLILTLNLYEAALLAIALFLVTRRGQRRDGRMLLLLQAFFLADFTFLNAEIATADLGTGLWVNAALFVLAGVKLGVVLRVLRPSFTPAQFGFVMLQIGLLFGLPCFMRWHNASHGTVGPRDFYALWWLLALLPALAEWLSRVDPRRAVAMSVAPRAQAAPTTTYLGLPYISLLTHIAILHYVYDVRFYGAHAAPLLLGLTLALHHVNPTTLVPRRDLLILRLLLPLAAVLVSMNDPFVFRTPFSYPALPVSSLSLSTVGAFLVYVYCFLWPHARLFLSAGAAAAAFYALGPSRRQVVRALEWAWDWGAAAGDRLLPKTLADWGTIGLVASFGFLGLGFWVSLRKHPAPSEDPVATPPGNP